MIYKKLAFQLFWMIVPLSWCVSQDWKDHYHFNPQQTLNRIKFLDGMTGTLLITNRTSGAGIVIELIPVPLA